MALFSALVFGFEPRTWFTTVLPSAFIVYYALWIVYARTLHPLAKIPGPFWPSVSRTWLMYRGYAGDLEIVQRALHERYGPLLRVAPDEVVCSDPQEIPTVYRIMKPLEKTVWYLAWRPMGMGARPDMFTNVSEQDHAAYKRIVGHVYSLTNVLKSEKNVDTTVSIFIERLDNFAAKNQAFDFGLWLEMYCFDNIGVVFFGKHFGFLKDSIDYGGYISAVHKALPFLSVLAMSPTYARPFVMASALAIPKLFKAVLAVDGVKQTAERESFEAQARTEQDNIKRVDLTSQLLTVVREKGEKNNFGIREVISESWVAVMAGSDSTAISLRSIFYFMMKHPYVLAKTRAEVDSAFADGTLTQPVQYNQAIQLPYLTAVIKESIRIHSPFAVPIQRYSPPEGITLCGTYIPSGWRVGLNPAVIQHNKEVFGSDAKSFRPERWLSDDADQIKLMDKCTMAFGVGTRTCTGRHLAMIEIYKIVCEILRRYTFELTHDGEWKTQNVGFCNQTGVTCRFKKRDLDD